MLRDGKRMLQIVNERGLKVNKARLNMYMIPTSSLDPSSRNDSCAEQ